MHSFNAPVTRFSSRACDCQLGSGRFGGRSWPVQFLSCRFWTKSVEIAGVTCRLVLARRCPYSTNVSLPSLLANERFDRADHTIEFPSCSFNRVGRCRNNTHGALPPVLH